MKVDTSLKRLFQRPPNLLLSQALGRPIVVKRILSTESIVGENLHPDQLFELDNGTIVHAELHGYWMDGFACRNLIYYGLVLRDYKRPPQQIVFWIGQRPVGIDDGLDDEPALRYRYRVVDVRDLDGEPLLASGNVNESIFALLCRLDDPRGAVVQILHQIVALPAGEQREAILQLLLLSGLRGLERVVQQEVATMPIEIDIHENSFLEGIFQQGCQQGHQQGHQEGHLQGQRQGQQQGYEQHARKTLLLGLERKFGPVSADLRTRIEASDLADLDRWILNLLTADAITDVFI
jgi:predicted transposase YdaD